MKILFSPSEAKSSILGSDRFSIDSLIFPNLNRKFVLDKYENFIKTSYDLTKIFGTKNQNLINYYKNSFQQNVGIKAILRYDGVAFKSLDYRNLNKDSQNYIDQNTLIFSNLFGVVRANDILPDYKLKQGENLGDFKIDKFYSAELKKILDSYLDDDILDLRANFYDKFYRPSKNLITLKFIKNGKIVSHFAKHYRGIILNTVALHQIKSVDDFLNLNFHNLKLIDIKEIKNKTEINFEII
ncbi:peroxide stress protein YaaA [Campylobacter sp. FMV-PI01]|uniref:Peroxide stress protein YaaA n=1 Tax=Campylobacter portucalensis TaxID=2608384 RepID=A0A6L5WGJ6_9BACT|nr:YaaA family protein [Campylobacter portucalensis]MSN96290.1 peroxide stress protein YaaA [Campylobacter portucalensis]